MGKRGKIPEEGMLRFPHAGEGKREGEKSQRRIKEGFTFSHPARRRGGKALLNKMENAIQLSSL